MKSEGSIELDLEVYKNLVKMLKSNSVEDRDLGIECIKNIEVSDTMLKLICKTLDINTRNIVYQKLGKCFFWSYQDLTLETIAKELKIYSEKVEQDIYNYVKNKIYESSRSGI